MNFFKEIKSTENGNVTILALMILVILTLIGLSASRTSTTDIQIAKNLIPYKQDFYISEGGQNRESAFIGGGGYSVIDINTVSTLVSDHTHSITTGKTYDYTVVYEGHFNPPKGYDTATFARYDYSVETLGGDSDYQIDARYYKVGPKAE